MAQSRNLPHAKPAFGILSDIECQGGCGVVPIRYQDKQYVHSLQWTIGLELMLLVRDPWQVFLTTDHPNGGPFTAYPHLIRLLMDRSFRRSMLEAVHAEVAQRSLLREIDREYTLDEIAIVTRAAPAKVLGLKGLGSLQTGCQATLAAYTRQADWESTFQSAKLVMKSGTIIVQDGRVTGDHAARERWRAVVDYDRSLVDKWSPTMTECLRANLANLEIQDEELQLLGQQSEQISQRFSGASQ